jgi:predicted Zn-dependent protease with MMP-like domain
VPRGRHRGEFSRSARPIATPRFRTARAEPDLDPGGPGGGSPRYHRVVIEISRDDFEQLVQRAIDEVPEPFTAALDEVAVVVEEHSPPGQWLYGLYNGVPRTLGDGTGAFPARITIYMHPMLDQCGSADEVVRQVRITVLHELGHHLGFDERRLHDLGYG